jgi:hypothetical protein
MAQRGYALSALGYNGLVEPFFCVKFCVCCNSFSFDPITKDFWQVVKTTSVMVFAQICVEDSQAPGACNYGYLSVWFTLKLSLYTFAVGNTRPANLKMRWVQSCNFIPTTLSA